MIEAIFVAKISRQSLQQVHTVQVVVGCGITWDGHFKKAKKKAKILPLLKLKPLMGITRFWASLLPLNKHAEISLVGVLI
tara:strand:+ start:282 stop:521 length:240 start_codon:yes stop_codon:yes gene_type:complete